MALPKLELEHPEVQKLIEYNDEYKKLNDEYIRDWKALETKYRALQAPLLEKRKQLIRKGERLGYE